MLVILNAGKDSQVMVSDAIRADFSSNTAPQKLVVVDPYRIATFDEYYLNKFQISPF
jgi:hypothetical protein